MDIFDRLKSMTEENVYLKESLDAILNLLMAEKNRDLVEGITGSAKTEYCAGSNAVSGQPFSSNAVNLVDLCELQEKMDGGVYGA